jgi:hypothetical protein
MGRIVPSHQRPIGKLLPGAVAHDEAGVVEFFNRPWWGEASRGDQFRF